MRRVMMIMILAMILSVALLIAPAYGQRVDQEGKTWLGSCSEPAGLNVTGIWKDPKWGNITLSQHEGSRQVLGSGDGWNISGVVSGKTICLLFFTSSKVDYSAKLTAAATGSLNGGYVKGLLSDKSKKLSMNLVKR
jgi:hypothetical protein